MVMLKPELLQDRYLLLRELGQGREGVVYLAEDIRLAGKLRAVKCYREERLLSGQRERDLLIRINHPFMPTLVDYLPPAEEFPGGAVVTDYIAAQNLGELFSTAGCRMGEQTVLGLGIQLCRLLEYLHASAPEPIIHRDLKPSNLLLDVHGQLHLIDFGSSRRYQPLGMLDTEQLGTAGFAAPEQYQSVQSDERTDLYGLGAVLYYLLHQSVVVGFQSQIQQSTARCRDSMNAILYKLLQAEPSRRYGSAREARKALEAELQRRIYHGKRGRKL